MRTKISKLITACGCAILGISATAATAALIPFQTIHTFSIDDIQGGDNTGNTYGGYVGADGEVAGDKSILCGLESSPACPDDGSQPQVEKDGSTLYPIDAAFGYVVSDFVGAEVRQKGVTAEIPGLTISPQYSEGFAGNINDENGAGLAVSNTATSLFKVHDPYGTWCRGVAGSPVKCSSEHYVVMEHVLSCYQSNPYIGIDDGIDQRDLTDPETGEVIDSCSNHSLDNTLKIVENFVVSELPLTSVEPGDQMEANESTVRDDIAVGRDYSITLKDDGKPLYRWGNAVKRPTDIRIYAQMDLPPEWTDEAAPEEGYTVTSAKLTVKHTITNNPNDQIRPEDMENEGATGRLPAYDIVGERWISKTNCYTGNGEDIQAGTLFKDSAYAGKTHFPVDLNAFSEDLKEGFTNAWYTTIHRDPFEEMYGKDSEGNQIKLSGPRWRLKANKFGQDLPSLEIPSAENECTQPPYKKGGKKYEVGDFAITTIDLLDFDAAAEGVSPLRNSRGWIDAVYNEVNEFPAGVTPTPVGISINNLPLTPKFDLAIYVKGDKRAVKIYNATLDIEWDKPSDEE
ncbi:hypothetical protein M3P05_02310 [Sansalvadorimonas sp. 2012CJ34-2]|uniref:Uncharacterized protein n=1 Tax=Parendozoicomonas callyspongiae TaxID=2942213 RepID=A0ABT0PDZ9_9GAMM|nr:hypothetical protein [Sansalvadorimonas sp. 2012CJ34-2]MCL6268783.1 hypothetical protein [Sansalvadorimonas sp. 2012CJ34-2]